MLPVVLLAGGFGTRLKSVTGDLPKVLAQVDGVPFLERLLRDFSDQGVREVVLSLHYRPDLVIDAVGEMSGLGTMKVRWVIESQPLGTGGAVLWAAERSGIQGQFWVANGDTVVERGWLQMENGGTLRQSDEFALLGVTRVPDISRYGEVQFEPETGRITKFCEKQDASRAGWIYSGMSRLHPDLFAGFASGASFSLEKDVFARILPQGRLFAVPLEGDFIDIGIPEDYRTYCERQRR